MLIQIKIIFTFMDHIIWERGTSVCCWQYSKAPGRATHQYLNDCLHSDTIMAYRAHISLKLIQLPLTIGRKESTKIRTILKLQHSTTIICHGTCLYPGKSHPCEPLMPLVSMKSQCSSSPKTARYSIWISTPIKNSDYMKPYNILKKLLPLLYCYVYSPKLKPLMKTVTTMVWNWTQHPDL